MSELLDKLSELSAASRLSGFIRVSEALQSAAEELTRMAAKVEEEQALRERMADLLDRSITAIRGPAPERTLWSFADLPERCAAVVAERDALRADALRWRHFIGKRFVMGSGMVLMDAHRTADKSELLYWIDTQMKAQPAAEKTDV